MAILPAFSPIEAAPLSRGARVPEVIPQVLRSSPTSVIASSIFDVVDHDVNHGACANKVRLESPCLRFDEPAMMDNGLSPFHCDGRSGHPHVIPVDPIPTKSLMPPSMVHSDYCDHGKWIESVHSIPTRPAVPQCHPCSTTNERAAPQAQTPSKHDHLKVIPSLPISWTPSMTTAMKCTKNNDSPPPPSPALTPTPQNLKDNPERLAKVKTEMCRYYEQGIECPWGYRCNYAHGEHELKFRYSTLILMESAGQISNAATYLVRPCLTWVATGAW